MNKDLTYYYIKIMRRVKCWTLHIISDATEFPTKRQKKTQRQAKCQKHRRCGFFTAGYHSQTLHRFRFYFGNPRLRALFYEVTYKRAPSSARMVIKTKLYLAFQLSINSVKSNFKWSARKPKLYNWVTANWVCVWLTNRLLIMVIIIIIIGIAINMYLIIIIILLHLHGE